jgi:hypothetical protein
MKRIFTITFYYFLIFHLTCSPAQNNSSDPNANFLGMLMNILGFNSFQKEQSAAQASTQVTGILRDANGDPLAFAILDLSLLQGKSAEGNLTRVISDTRTKTDADGAYILKLRLGKFEIGVTKADGTKMGSFSLDVVNATVPPTVSSTSNTFAVSGVGISSIGSPPPSITSAKLESITYTNSTLYQNIATIITPKIKGGKPTSCTISPSLPSGLSLNSTTCVISGTSTVTQSETAYTIKVSNYENTISGNVNLSVVLAPPSNLVYIGLPFTFLTYVEVDKKPTYIGSPITNCSISPPLPSGLIFNNSSCEISGTPNVSSNLTNYTIQATNSVGSTTSNIFISISLSPASYVSIPIGLLKTGQTISYLSGDDGSYQKGGVRTFTRGGTTGIVWQRCSAGQNDDESCSGTALTYSLVEANSYCNSLMLAGKKWRLPTVNELNDLVDYGKFTPTIDLIVFPNTQSGGYWSSHLDSNLTSPGVFIDFSNGEIVGISEGYIRCISKR